MINLLKDVAEESGKLLMHYYNQELTFKRKTTQHDLVSQADVAAQGLIRRLLLKGMREQGYKAEEVGFIGEEGLFKPRKYTFIIDPLDGTANFASGLEWFTTVIALLKDNQIVAGVVYLPAREEFYLAERGQGAWRISQGQKQSLHIRAVEISNSLMATCFPYKRAVRERQVSLCLQLFPHLRGIRSVGAFTWAAAYFTANIFNLAFLIGYTWDLAAPRVIIEEAGGRLYNWQGQELTVDYHDTESLYQVLVCHPQNLEKIIKIIRTDL